MLEFIKYLSGKFFIFGSIAILGGFVIIFLLGSYDLNEKNGGGPSTSSELRSGNNAAIANNLFAEPSRSNTVTKESAKAAAEALLKNSLPAELFLKNTTEELAENISKKIIEKNPDGPGSVGAQKLSVPNPESIVNDYVQKGIDGFNYNALKPKITDSDIRIIADESSEAFSTYVKSFFGILNNGGEVPSGDPQTALATMIRVYGDYLTGLYALPVPKIFAELHKQQIALIAAEKNIYELVQNYEEDPLKAILAMKALEVSKSEITNVYTEIVKLGAERGAKL